MKYFNTLKFNVRKLGKIKKIEPEAKARLAWFDEINNLKKNNLKPNIRNLCKFKFGISKTTFYRWKRKYNPHCLNTLNNQHRGRIKGHRQLSSELVIKLVGWKLSNPAKGHEYCWFWFKKYEEELPCCPTTIYNLWKDKKLLHLVRLKKKRKRRPFKYIKTVKPGYLQIDTKHLSKHRFQYTIKDLASRYRKLFGTDRINGITTINILEIVLKSIPFKIQFIQFDNGLEFGKAVEKWLDDHQIIYQHTWVREKDQNGAVESSHKTDEREFYSQFTPSIHTLKEFQQALSKWEYEYNNLRLHTAINYQTPMEYINNYYNKVSR